MFYQKIFKSFNHSLHSTKGGIPHDVMNYFVSLRIFYASGTQDAEVRKNTVKFLNFIAFQFFNDLYELSTKHKFSSYLNHHLHKLSSVDWPVLSRYHRYLLWTGWKSCQEKKKFNPFNNGSRDGSNNLFQNISLTVCNQLQNLVRFKIT